jgi:hypothetical protein
MSLSPDDRFLRWQEWVPKINTAVVRLWYHREVWQEVRDLLTSEQERYGSDGVFLGAFTKMYIDSQAMAVRRIVDPGSDVVSFARLLDELWEHPEVLSRERFRQTCRDAAGPGWSDAFADEDYYRYGGPGGDELDPVILIRDRERLLTDAVKIRKFANKTVAHLDRRAFEDQVTFGELAQVVDDITELWDRYYLLLTGSGKATPSIAGDPLAPFRVALDTGASWVAPPLPPGWPTVIEGGRVVARGLLMVASSVTNALGSLAARRFRD